MRLRTIGVIFRKELLDTLRDRRTLIFMVALPILVVPGLMTIVTRVMQSEQKKTHERRLVVQVEPDERDRFCDFLRGRLAAHRNEAADAVRLLGPTVEAPLQVVAHDLGREPLEVLVGLPSDPTIAAHPRAEELKGALAEAQRRAMTEVQKLLDQQGDREGGAVAPPADGGSLVASLKPEEARQAQRLLQLLGPLVTFDYVAAADVASRPAIMQAAPVATLPPNVKGDPVRVAAAVAIGERRIQALLRVPRVLDGTLVERKDTVSLEVVYDSTVDLSAEAERRIDGALSVARQLTTDERLAKADLPVSFVKPVELDARNAAPPSKEVLKAIAGILPYVLILMCFLGGMNPATDLGAGEKERLTLETLLVAPASRLEITVGKFGVVFVAALVASLVATGSLAYTFTSGIASKELSSVLHFQLDARTIVVCLALIAPLAATFASIMLAMSIYAKSQEAQSMMVPLQFLIIVPAMLSMIPTIELDARFACVPVLNVALGLRTLLTAGGAPLPWTSIAIIFASTTLLAGVALAFCARRFRQERVIFRS
jgi:sodium transport system permease protein